jgi:hypothetical protein
MYRSVVSKLISTAQWYIPGIEMSLTVVFIIISVRFKWYVASIKISLCCVRSYQNITVVRTYITGIKVLVIVLSLVVHLR